MKQLIDGPKVRVISPKLVRCLEIMREASHTFMTVILIRIYVSLIRVRGNGLDGCRSQRRSFHGPLTGWLVTRTGFSQGFGMAVVDT
jgi:hypothetical protein